MSREVNCLNSKVLIDYVEETVGISRPWLNNLPELDGVEDPRAFLTDDHNWISSSLMKELYRKAREFTGDETVAVKAGFESVSKKRLGYVQEFFFKAITTPAMGLKRVQSINDKFNRTKRIEIVELSRNGGVVRLHWFKGMDLSKDFCWMNQGIYKAITTVWGLPPMEVTETECYFRGGSCCEYHLDWKPGGRRLFFKNLLVNLIPGHPYFKTALAELEKERNLLEEKFAESRSLTISLAEKIKRLAAVQEASRLAVSPTELSDVLNEVMTLMVKVTGFERAILMLLDDEGRMLRFGQGVGAPEEMFDKFRDYEVPLSRMSNLMIRVAHGGLPVFIEDVKSSDLNLDNPIIKYFKPASFFAVPVSVRDKVIGVLVADKGSTLSTITQEDRDYLITFVNQIAGPLEQSRLLDKNRKSYLNSIKALVMALEARDPYTRGHSERVTDYSVELANVLDFPPSNVDMLRDIVPLHDIGKLGIPDSMLHKKTPLEKHEIEIIRNHTVVGTQIVAPLDLGVGALSIVRNHHEWFDGGGYPEGLAAEEISEVARIVSVTDAFDAMTTRRPYRAGMSIRAALKQLEDGVETQFDPSIVKAFVGAVKSELIRIPINIPQL